MCTTRYKRGLCCSHKGRCIKYWDGCKHSKRIKMDCKNFLQETWSRLANEMEPYLTEIHRMSEYGDLRGFWFISREVFPVIDVVGNALYKKEGPQKILEELGQKKPYLVWEMYRHSLIHEDRPRAAKHLRKNVNWSIALGVSEVDNSSSQVNILNPEYIYQRLLNLLVNKRETTKRKYVSIEESVVFCKYVDRSSPILKEIYE